MASEAVTLARLAAKERARERNFEREKLLYDKLLTPDIVRLALLGGIVAYSTYVTRSKQRQGPVASALALTMPTVGVPMLAASAGVTDWRALLAISGVSGGLAVASAEMGLNEVGRSLLDSVTLEAPGTDFPIVSLAGPIPMLQWLREHLT